MRRCKIEEMSTHNLTPHYTTVHYSKIKLEIKRNITNLWNSSDGHCEAVRQGRLTME